MELVSILVSVVTALIGLLIGIVASTGRLNRMNEILIRLEVKFDRVEEHEKMLEQLFDRMRTVEAQMSRNEGREEHGY